MLILSVDLPPSKVYVVGEPDSVPPDSIQDLQSCSLLCGLADAAIVGGEVVLEVPVVVHGKELLEATVGTVGSKLELCGVLAIFVELHL